MEMSVSIPVGGLSSFVIGYPRLLPFLPTLLISAIGDHFPGAVSCAIPSSDPVDAIGAVMGGALGGAREAGPVLRPNKSRDEEDNDKKKTTESRSKVNNKGDTTGDNCRSSSNLNTNGHNNSKDHNGNRVTDAKTINNRSSSSSGKKNNDVFGGRARGGEPDGGEGRRMVGSGGREGGWCGKLWWKRGGRFWQGEAFCDPIKAWNGTIGCIAHAYEENTTWGALIL